MRKEKEVEESDFHIIRPEWIRLTDNRRGFSDKIEWWPFHFFRHFG